MAGRVRRTPVLALALAAMLSLASAARSTIIVSVGVNGAPAGTGAPLLPGIFPAVSDDGRYVAFASASSDHVPGDTNDALDVFRRDVVSGVTIRVSVSSAGEQANGWSLGPSISGEGSAVAFASPASNLVPGDTNGKGDVFVWRNGVVVRASESVAGVQADGHSQFTSLSSDGRYIAFHSDATNLTPGDANGASDVFVKDLVTGAITLASLQPGGAQFETGSYEPALSAGGARVAFQAQAVDPPGLSIFVHDLATHQTSLASVTSAGDPIFGTQEAAISADGNTVAFSAPSLIDPQGHPHFAPWSAVFARDIDRGLTEEVSVSSPGVPGVTPPSPDGLTLGGSRAPAVSSDGRFVAFHSNSPVLVPGDTNGAHDVFVRDRLAHSTARVSLSSADEQGDGDSVFASISGDGRHVAFASLATNFAVGDGNGQPDIFVRDRGPATCTNGRREEGPVSGPLHDHEGDLGPAGGIVHTWAGCTALFRTGL